MFVLALVSPCIAERTGDVTIRPELSAANHVQEERGPIGSHASDSLVKTAPRVEGKAPSDGPVLGFQLAPHSQFRTQNLKGQSISNHHTYGDAPFKVLATSNSPGAITYSLISGNGTVTPEGIVTLTGAGSLTLQAYQAATADFTSAAVQETLFVSPGSPTINFVVPEQTREGSFTVSASSNSTGTFTYSVSSGPAKIAGGLVTITGAGIVVIEATEVADANYIAGVKDATIVVDPQDFSFTNQKFKEETVAPGNIVSYSFSISPLYQSYGEAVTFTVTGLPANAIAKFTPSALAANAGPSNVQLNIQMAAQAAYQEKAVDMFPVRGVAAAAIILLAFSDMRKLRTKMACRLILMLWALLGLTSAALLSGCGSVAFEPNLKSYSLSVVATSGSIQHMQSVVLNVQ